MVQQDFKFTQHLLFGIGIGFLYKAYFGTNREVQVRKVFWHDTRYVHASLYLLSSLYLKGGEKDITSILLVLDILFSVLYRYNSNQ